jgi:epoxide hydrolase-like predicted phosphatase
MSIRAVVFDIGGVLELTPPTGWIGKWETRLSLQPGEIGSRLSDVFRAGSIGRVSEADVENAIGARLGLDQADVERFIDDLWTEYLGTLNGELDAYFRSLRPRYQTAIISNSFVGAREREQERYRFEDACDFIIYSHEAGLEKPDPRIFELTCERLRVQPNEMIFLDDHEPHVVAARRIGIHGIVFRTTAQAITDIEALLHVHANN